MEELRKTMKDILSIISIAMERTVKELWEQYKEDVTGMIFTLAILGVWALIVYILKSIFVLFLPSFVAWTLGTLLGIPIVYVLLMFIYNISAAYDDYRDYKEGVAKKREPVKVEAKNEMHN
jgi:hypothetical protein